MTVALINVFIDNSIHVCNALWSHPPLTYLLLIPSRLSPHQVPTSHSSLFMFFLLCDSPRGLPRASCVDIPYPAIHWSLSNSPMSTPGHNDFLSSAAARAAHMEPTDLYSQNLPSQSASLEYSPVKCLVGDRSILET